MRSTHRFRRQPRLEHLENRQLLAGNLGSIELGDGGVLTILGTNKNDRVVVTQEASVDGSGDQLRVALNSLEPLYFAVTEVSSLSIDVGKGNDKVQIGATVDIDAVILGGAGNDDLRGGLGNDMISAGAGNDKADGGGGDDQVFGEAGNDKVAGGDGIDTVDGGDGQDHVNGGAGDDVLLGGAGHDLMKGGDGNDQMDGGAGKDHLAGQVGDDTLLGGDSNDKLEGGFGNDLLDGGGGQDHLWGGEGDDELHGGAGKDHIKGGAGDDEIWGDAGDDHLWGDAGNDWLYGGDGNDKMAGGEGDDNLKGEAGNDHLNGGAGNNLLDGDEGKNKLINGVETDFDAPPPPPPLPVFQPLVATLNGSIESGAAHYGRQTTELGEETFLLITVVGATPGLSLSVWSGSTFLGALVILEDGTGELRLSSLPGGNPLPAGFQPVAGDGIHFVSNDDATTVITGTFAIV